MLQMITGKSSKIELIRAFNGLTMKSVVENRFPSLGRISREHGNDIMEICVGVLISDLNTTFEGSLSKDAIEEIIAEATTGLMLNHCLETLFLVCKKLKQDDKIFKLTVNKVVRAIHDGLEEYQKEVMAQNYNNHLANQFHDPIENRRSEQEKKLDHEALLMLQKMKKKP